MIKVYRGYQIIVERGRRHRDGPVMNYQITRLSDGYIPLEGSVIREGTVHDALMTCVRRINTEMRMRDPWNQKSKEKRNA